MFLHYNPRLDEHVQGYYYFVYLRCSVDYLHLGVTWVDEVHFYFVWTTTKFVLTDILLFITITLCPGFHKRVYQVHLKSNGKSAKFWKTPSEMEEMNNHSSDILIISVLKTDRNQ